MSRGGVGLTESLWRGSLLPLGRAAAPKPASAHCQDDRVGWFGACCARARIGRREQAPSPQSVVYGHIRPLIALVCLSVKRCLFKPPQRYVLKATNPCAVAYGYARIRRLVRLGAAR
ncbi:hypothetical protein EB795_00640 [Pseudomonas mandelii]|nr:hypothetical protein [Pseudomonas mandelii]